MDIMEGSRDLTELLDNEVVQDIVDQTKGLVEQVIKQVTGGVALLLLFVRSSVSGVGSDLAASTLARPPAPSRAYHGKHSQEWSLQGTGMSNTRCFRRRSPRLGWGRRVVIRVV